MIDLIIIQVLQNEQDQDVFQIIEKKSQLQSLWDLFDFLFRFVLDELSNKNK
jgi:hypothetical protein